MIKVNELRVGNIFWESYGVYGVVTAININNKGISPDTILGRLVKGTLSGQFGREDITPVILTEELLVQYGFEKINHIHGYSFFTLHKSKVNKCNIDIYNTKTLYMSYSVNHCQYLHQLQNLYFAITGNEIKLINDNNDTLR